MCSAEAFTGTLGYELTPEAAQPRILSMSAVEKHVLAASAFCACYLRGLLPGGVGDLTVKVNGFGELDGADIGCGPGTG
jgi:hypothetical protein